jgi:hypothetical protein
MIVDTVRDAQTLLTKVLATGKKPPRVLVAGYSMAPRWASCWPRASLASPIW